MKNLLIATAIVMAACPGAAAAQAALPPAATHATVDRLPLARQFINLTQPEQAFLTGFRDGLANSVSTREFDSEADRAEAERKMAKLYAAVEPKLREMMPTITEGYAKAYADEFTAAELNEMIAFARTASGRHFLTLAGSIERHPAIVQSQAKVMGSIAPLFQATIQQDCAEKAAKRVAAGDRDASCPLGS